MSVDIEDLRPKLRKLFRTTKFWLAVFIICVITANGAFSHTATSTVSHQDKARWSYGGPVNSEKKTVAALGLNFIPPQYSSFPEEGGTSFVYADTGLAVGVSYPYSNVIPTRRGLKEYKVREGDTLSGIAAKFGVTLETIKYANLDVGSVISPGDELTILPVSGILYRIQEGDTLEGVAARYRISPELVEKYNPEYQKLFESPGEMVILPYAKPLDRWSYADLYKENLPKLDNYFTLPAVGWNWGKLHHYNAVDIAADCGDPVYAAADGIVSSERYSSDGSWNDGYGNTIYIEHPNGTYTLYAHNQKNLVFPGDYVLQGEKIALIGNSGNTHGPTGCHLHFEVHGAQNPFAVK